jgi:hypothetical protein
MIEQHSCDSVASFVRKVCAVRTRWTNRYGEFFDPWFRGQRRAGWSLVPNIYRSRMLEDEADIRLEFRRRALQLIAGHVPADEWQSTCGIRDTAVFPDLEGLSRELIRFYTDPWF